jgi:hypothetical protein
MNIQKKTLQITAGAVLAIGAAAAVVLGGTRAKKEVTLPRGTELVATLDHEVSTARSHAGDAIVLRTVEPIPVGDNHAIPAGAEIRGSIVAAKSGGRIAGAPELALRFTELEVDGERHEISADAFRVTGRNDAGKSALAIGGGAVAGGVVGRVLGGKGGTVPGAVVGAAIGTGVAVQSQGDELVLPPGQRLRIRLSAPVTVSYRPHGERPEKTDR